VKPTEECGRSLVAEFRKIAAAGPRLMPKVTDAERAESLREYQKLVDQLPDLVREYVVKQRSLPR
jgi:hypothetical protein